MDNLPNDILYTIGCLISLDDLVALSGACKKIRQQITKSKKMIKMLSERWGWVQLVPWETISNEYVIRGEMRQAWNGWARFQHQLILSSFHAGAIEQELCNLERNRFGFRLPLHLRAWLALRNGQTDTVFGQGTRLLSGVEIANERDERIQIGVDSKDSTSILPISTKSGIKQWFVRDDGTIILQSGWNSFQFGNLIDWMRSWSSVL